MRFKGPVATALALSIAACATNGEPMPPQTTVTCPPTRGWNAWINAMPGPGAVPTLIVTGEVNLPPGTRAELSPGPLDRMMPPAQRFTLSLEPGPRGGPAPGGWTQVRGEVKPALGEYRAVLVGCDGKEIAKISPVGTAH
ncbi:MAG: hypothetical protein KDE55_16375 [Novosphingobium sp.]|nr:hypothetical protein [Novosphingobium sp.]